MSIASRTGFRALAFGVMAAGGVCVPAMADDVPKCEERATQENVEGGNGGLSSSDHAAGAKKRFETMDTNRDGKLTAAEIGATHGAESIAWAQKNLSGADKIRKLDRNGDGSLTPAEYAESSQRMFEKLDINGDGYLSAYETRTD